MNAVAQLDADLQELGIVFAACERLTADPTDRRASVVEARRAINAVELAAGAGRDLRRSLEEDLARGTVGESPRTIQLALAFSAARLEAGQRAVLSGAIARSWCRGL